MTLASTFCVWKRDGAPPCSASKLPLLDPMAAGTFHKRGQHGGIRHAAAYT